MYIVCQGMYIVTTIYIPWPLKPLKMMIQAPVYGTSFRAILSRWIRISLVLSRICSMEIWFYLPVSYRG